MTPSDALRLASAILGFIATGCILAIGGYITALCRNIHSTGLGASFLPLTIATRLPTFVSMHNSSTEVSIIALITDFGLKDPYVAEMKAVILNICPKARIINVSTRYLLITLQWLSIVLMLVVDALVMAIITYMEERKILIVRRAMTGSYDLPPFYPNSS